jgi:hypothetical protein
VIDDGICKDCGKTMSRMVKHDCVRFERNVFQKALEEILTAYLADTNHCPAYKLAQIAENAIKAVKQ